MDTAKRARAVLAEAERKLRDLAGQAAGAGQYDLTVRIATLAKALAAMAGDFDKVGQSGASTTDTTARARGHIVVEGLTKLSSAISSCADDQPRLAGNGRSRRTPQKGEYPKFVRRGDHLVKVAWSKRQRAEYQHKTPRRVAELLAAAIAKRAANGRLFTSEDIFPLKDPLDGSEIPSYQAYAALAWFRAAGLVRPHGRRGYTAKNPSHLSELLVSAWERLRESPV